MKNVLVFPRGRRHAWVAEGLRRDIMLGEIEPGATVTELEVAARFQCSQSTVREALLLLQEEGLVQRSQHKSTRVSNMTDDEALEMLRLRRDMECRAAQRLFTRDARRASDLGPALRGHLAAMEAAAAANDEYALAEADRDFHRRLFAEARLPSLEPLLLRCLIHNHRFKILNGRKPHDLHHTARRHGPIIEAVERRDTTGLVAALAHHASTIFDDGELLLDGNQALPASRPRTKPGQLHGDAER
jgi:GntR family transcriptional regulator, rspAB operon transcriptional repressor